MTRELPIACSLDAAELSQRIAEIGALGRDSLLSVSPNGNLRFRGDERTRERLEAIIAAESECCAFLGFELRSRGDELILSISAPDEARSVAAELAEAFAAPTRAPR